MTGQYGLFSSSIDIYRPYVLQGYLLFQFYICALFIIVIFSFP